MQGAPMRINPFTKPKTVATIMSPLRKVRAELETFAKEQLGQARLLSDEINAKTALRSGVLTSVAEAQKHAAKLKEIFG